MAITDINQNTLLEENHQSKSSEKDKFFEADPHPVPGPSSEETKAVPFKPEIVWIKAAFILTIHVLAFYGFSLAHLLLWPTIIWGFLIGLLCGVGVQVGAHRLWTHRAFKATFGLRVFLAACQTMAGQKTIYYWVRDHRVHHKYSETDADPHDSRRGFWFAHMGWILTKKHPEVLRKGAQLNLSDIEADPIVMFQKRNYVPLLILLWGVIPAGVPWYFWGESIWLSILACCFFRHVYLLNVTGLVNSYAHMYGFRPYDTRICPAESRIVRHLMMGEGFHNYHHVFPWDYSASELGPLDVFNPATAFIDACSWAGLAYDLKKASPAMVASKMNSHGDVSTQWRTSTACEWLGGLVMVFAPWLALRWIVTLVMS